MKCLKTHLSFGGKTQYFEHFSQQTQSAMRFSCFVPPGDIKGCIIWLSGLSCTEENFISKAGAQKYLAAAQLMVVCPDTSPRGLQLPDEHLNWDFGSGASFYVDATTSGYDQHYRMYSYVAEELYGLIQEQFAIGDRISIMGHSMGGHGALVIGLRAPEKFRSISAFAPIAHPSQVPWGQKAFRGYLGEDRQSWAAYDACQLLADGHRHPHALRVDQGTADPFLLEQLQPEELRAAAARAGQPLELQLREGYDHSYYFIATFIEDHINFHSQALKGLS